MVPLNVLLTVDTVCKLVAVRRNDIRVYLGLCCKLISQSRVSAWHFVCFANSVHIAEPERLRDSMCNLDAQFISGRMNTLLAASGYLLSQIQSKQTYCSNYPESPGLSREFTSLLRSCKLHADRYSVL